METTCIIYKVQEPDTIWSETIARSHQINHNGEGDLVQRANKYCVDVARRSGRKVRWNVMDSLQGHYVDVIIQVDSPAGAF